MQHHLKHLSALPILLLIILVAGPRLATAQDSPDPLEAQAESLVVSLGELQTEYDDLEVQLAESSGEDSLVTYRQMTDMGITFLDQVYELAHVLDKKREKGLDTAETREFLTGILDRIPDALSESAEDVASQLEEARAKADTAEPGELALIEEDVADLEDRLDDLYEIAGRHIKVLEMLDMEEPALHKRLTDALTNRADLTAGRLRLSIEERDRFEDQAGQYPDEASFRQRADAARVAVNSGVTSMERTVSVMDDLGMDVTEYRTLLVEATGELARGLSDSKVAFSLVERWFENGREWLANRGPNFLVKLLVFFAILFAFRLLSRVARKAVRRSIDSSKLDPSQLLRNMIVNISGNLVMVFGLMIALSQIGISLGPLLAGVGVVSGSSSGSHSRKLLRTLQPAS